MGIMNKIFTAIRGGARETGEAIVDQQAIRILEQEIYDAKGNLAKAKDSLATVIAEKTGVEKKVKQLQAKVSEHEGYAVAAMEKGDDALAMEIAERIAEFENELTVQQDLLDTYNTNVTNLKSTVSQTGKSISTLEREVNVVKTTEAAQKAQRATVQQFSGSNSSMSSATESLKRIKERQEKAANKMKAVQELQAEESGDDLTKKLEAAGIRQGHAGASDVLARLKAKG